MKIYKKLQQNDIDTLRKAIEENCHDAKKILELLDKSKFPHCYKTGIFPPDFSDILINSSTESRDLDQSELPNIREVIESIRNEPSFLCQTNANRRLDGKMVRQYQDEFILTGNKPSCFFLVDRDYYPDMNPKGLFYVRDGMHHLVAYGLAVNMKEDGFPILGYYSTKKERV